MKERSWIEVDLEKFKTNLLNIKKKLPYETKILQIVKADAYGHGAYEIALEAEKNGVSYFGVANSNEGAILRYLGIKSPILILSPSLKTEIPEIIENNLTPAIFDLSFGKALNAYSKPITVHINVDTGMGRSGCRFDEASMFYKQVMELDNLTIEGVFTHFASSEENKSYTLQQYNKFERFLDTLEKIPDLVHVSNSAAAVLFNFPRTNMVRIGLLSYGVYLNDSLRNKIELRQIMSFHSRISQIKNAFPGESIGYNQTFTIQHPTKFGIILSPKGAPRAYVRHLTFQKNFWSKFGPLR